MAIKSLNDKIEHVEKKEDLAKLISDVKTIAFKQEDGNNNDEYCATSSCHCATYEGRSQPKDICSWSTCHCAAYKK